MMMWLTTLSPLGPLSDGMSDSMLEWRGVKQFVVALSYNTLSLWLVFCLTTWLTDEYWYIAVHDSGCLWVGMLPENGFLLP